MSVHEDEDEEDEKDEKQYYNELQLKHHSQAITFINSQPFISISPLLLLSSSSSSSFSANSTYKLTHKFGSNKSKSVRKSNHLNFLFIAVLIILFRVFVYIIILVNNQYSITTITTFISSTNNSNQNLQKPSTLPTKELYYHHVFQQQKTHTPLPSSLSSSKLSLPQNPLHFQICQQKKHQNELNILQELFYHAILVNSTLHTNYANISCKTERRQTLGSDGGLDKFTTRAIRMVRDVPLFDVNESSTYSSDSTTVDLYRSAVQNLNNELRAGINSTINASSFETAESSSISNNSIGSIPYKTRNFKPLKNYSTTAYVTDDFGLTNGALDFISTSQITTITPITTNSPSLLTRAEEERLVWNEFVSKMANLDLEIGSMVFTGGLLSLITVVGNLLVMLSFHVDKSLQTVSNYFLFSLAIADFLIGIISMPLAIIYIITHGWPLGATVCDLWLSVDYLNSNASVLNLLLISFDRFFSVTRPLSYRAMRTNRRACCFITLAWLISTMLWPPWIAAWPYIEGKRTVPANQCYIPFLESNVTVTIITATLAFWLPLLMMIWLYWRIYSETQKRNRELNSTGGVISAGSIIMTTSAATSSSDASKKAKKFFRDGKSTSTSGSEVGTTFAEKLVHLIHSSDCERAKRREASLTCRMVEHSKNNNNKKKQQHSSHCCTQPFPIELSIVPGEPHYLQHQHLINHHQQQQHSVNVSHAGNVPEQSMPKIFSTHDYADEMIHMEELLPNNNNSNGSNGLNIIESSNNQAKSSSNQPIPSSVRQSRQLQHPSLSRTASVLSARSRQNSRICWNCLPLGVTRWFHWSNYCGNSLEADRQNHNQIEVPQPCPACEYIKQVRRRFFAIQRQAAIDAAAEAAAKEKAAAEAAAAATAAIAAAIEARARKLDEQQQHRQSHSHKHSQQYHQQHQIVEVHETNDNDVCGGDFNQSEPQEQRLTTTTDPNDIETISIDESDNSVYTIVIKLEPSTLSGSSGNDELLPNATVKMVYNNQSLLSPSQLFNSPSTQPQLQPLSLIPLSIQNKRKNNINLPESSLKIEKVIRDNETQQPQPIIQSPTSLNSVHSLNEITLKQRQQQPEPQSTVATNCDDFDDENFELSEIELWAHQVNLTELGLDDDQQSENGSIHFGGCCSGLLRHGDKRVGGSSCAAATVFSASVNKNMPIMSSTGQYLLRCNVQPTKNERKAARILSAILLAFFITWTPYNVLGK